MIRFMLATLLAVTLTSFVLRADDKPEKPDKNIGVGAKAPADADIIIDGSRETLDEKWKYWEGPGFLSHMPIQWKIVPDPVDGGTCVMTDDRVADGGKYGTADIVTKRRIVTSACTSVSGDEARRQQRRLLQNR
jgi:hypothetical protein